MTHLSSISKSVFSPTFFTSFLAFILFGHSNLYAQGDWTTYDSATPVVFDCKDCYQLTVEQTGQKGCVWDPDLVDFSSVIDVEATLYFGDNDGGADGICLVFAPSPGCGTTGQGIGAAGIPNSVIIEFDTWDNGAGGGDIPDDHCALNINGDVTMPIFGPVGLGNIEDGLPHTMRFVWDGGSNFEVYFDGALVLSGSYDFVSILGGNEVSMGYTASTGGAVNVHIVCPGNDPVPPADEPVFVEFDLEVCEGTTGVPYGVDPKSGVTYTWTLPPGASGGTTGSTIAINWGDEGGEVCVLADNGCGESDTVCVLVEVIPIPEVSVENLALCVGFYNLEDLDLMNLLPGQNVSYHFSQLAAESGTPIMPSPPIVDVSGTYWLRIDAGEGCYQVLPFDITLEELELVVEQPDPVCAPASIELSSVSVNDVNNIPLVYFNYYISEIDAIQNVNPLVSSEVNTSGTYWVRVETEIGCWAVAAIEVVILEVPILEIVSPLVFCDQDSFDLFNLSITELSGIDLSELALSYYQSYSDAQQGFPALNNTIISQSGTYWVRAEVAGGCFGLASVEIQFIEASSAYVSGPDSICAGSVATLHFSFNGAGPFEIIYTCGTDTFQFVTPDTTYSVDVTMDSTKTISIISYSNSTPAGCPQIIGDSHLIFVYEPLEISPLSILCNGQEYAISFDFLNGDVGSWEVIGLDGIISGPSFTSENLQSGNPYAFQVFDQFGCDTLTFSGVFQCDCGTEAGTISADTLLLCPGDTLTFAHTGMFANLDDTLLWFLYLPPASSPLTPDFIFDETKVFYPVNQVPAILQNTIYHLVGVVGQKDGAGSIDMSDPCLSLTNIVAVIFDSQPEIITINAVPGFEFTCLDTLIQLEAEVSWGTIEGLYDWKTQGGNITSDPGNDTIDASGAGWYTVTALSYLGACRDTMSVYLGLSDDVPEVIIELPLILSCEIKEVTINAGGSTQGGTYIYQWTTSDGLILSGGNSLTPLVGSPGIYILSIIDTDNQCASQGSVQVFQNINPPVSDAGSDIVMSCNEPWPGLDGGNSTGQGDLEYLWSTQDGTISGSAFTAQIDILSTGTYILEVTDILNGCKATDTVSVIQIDGLVIEGVTMVPPDCNGDTDGTIAVAQITGGTGTYQMQINNTVLDAPGIFTGLGSGSYTLVIWDSGGCSWDTTVNIISPAPLGISIEAEVVVNSGSEVTLSPAVTGGFAPYTVDWLIDGQIICEGCETFSFSALADQEIQLIVTDNRGCQAVTSVLIKVLRIKTVYIPNSFSPNYDGINDMFGVYGGSSVSRVKRLALFDRWGNAMYDRADLKPDGSEGWDGTFRDTMMDPGVYVYYAVLEFTDGLERIYKGEVHLIK